MLVTNLAVQQRNLDRMAVAIQAKILKPLSRIDRTGGVVKQMLLPLKLPK
jgi:hypothetical protein